MLPLLPERVHRVYILLSVKMEVRLREAGEDGQGCPQEFFWFPYAEAISECFAVKYRGRYTR